MPLWKEKEEKRKKNHHSANLKLKVIMADGWKGMKTSLKAFSVCWCVIIPARLRTGKDITFGLREKSLRDGINSCISPCHIHSLTSYCEKNFSFFKNHLKKSSISVITQCSWIVFLDEKSKQSPFWTSLKLLRSPFSYALDCSFTIKT